MSLRELDRLVIDVRLSMVYADLIVGCDCWSITLAQEKQKVIFEVTEDEAGSAIELAETFHRVVRKWADLSESFYSPKVRAAARKKGIAMPTTLSGLQSMKL